MIKIRLNDLPTDNGIIKQILVQQGDRVKTWQNILIVSCGDSDIAISTLFDGIIETIYIAEGDKVKKGDVAFKININVDVIKENPPINNYHHDDNYLEQSPSNLETSINTLNHEQHLNNHFTAEFKNEPANETTVALEPELEAPQIVNDNFKTIINDLQEKNAAGTSKFREKILKKLNKNQEENDNETKNKAVENIKPEKPLSFREIIMSRVNNLQKDVTETELIIEPNIKKTEATSVRDNILKKMNLIKAGKINNTSKLEEINEIISQETTKDINSKYEPTGYYDKSRTQMINKNDKVVSSDLEELTNETNDALMVDKKKLSDDFDLQKKNLNRDAINNSEKINSSDYFNYHPLNNSFNINDQQVENKTSLMFSYNEMLAKSKIPTVQNNIQNSVPHMIINEALHEQTEMDQLSYLETRHKLSSLRNNAVNALLISNRQVPHLNLNCEVDMNNVISLCEKLTSRSNNKLRLNIMVFLVKAVSLALEEYPKINSSYDQSTNELIIKKYHHIAIARQNAAGLQTAVMKFADKLSIEQLAVEMERSDQRIRAKKALDNEFIGSTITIINFGISGSINGSLPIFSPNVAVIGIGKIVKKPIVVGKNLVIRHVANISLSVDQRAIDVYDAGQFLEVLKNTLEEPYILSLN